MFIILKGSNYRCSDIHMLINIPKTQTAFGDLCYYRFPCKAYMKTACSLYKAKVVKHIATMGIRDQ
jgi:hypothetical protein